MSRILLLAGILLAMSAVPATAQTPRGGFVITDFDVRITVAEDGSLRVREDITVDFGFREFRGIFRYVPVVYDLAPDTSLDIPDGGAPEEYARVIDIDEIQVSSTTGAPTATVIERPPSPNVGRINSEIDPYNLSIRVGEENTWISGVHRYSIKEHPSAKGSVTVE